MIIRVVDFLLTFLESLLLIALRNLYSQEKLILISTHLSTLIGK